GRGGAPACDGPAARRLAAAPAGALSHARLPDRRRGRGAGVDVGSHRAGRRPRPAMHGPAAARAPRHGGGARANPYRNPAAEGGRLMFHLHEKNAERKRLSGLVAKSAMRVPAAFTEVGKQVFADGALSKKHKELTALA